MIEAELAKLIDDRPEDGVFRVNRAIFDDPALFDLEMARIFEGGWVFLGLAAQAPEPHDFFTTDDRSGARPGQPRRRRAISAAFVNSCPHQGAMIAQTVCRQRAPPRLRLSQLDLRQRRPQQGRQVESGRLLRRTPSIPTEPRSRPPARLRRVSRLPVRQPHARRTAAGRPSRRGGEAARSGCRPERGRGRAGSRRVTFTYDANWKLQLENCSDDYHFTSSPPLLHPPARAPRAPRRMTPSCAPSGRRIAAWAEDAKGVQGGTFTFPNGHVLNWGLMAVSTRCRSTSVRSAGGAGRRGAARLDVQHAQPHHLPEPSDRGECVEPAARDPPARPPAGPRCGPGASPRTARATARGGSGSGNMRISSIPRGMATPDDTVSYENCQKGFASRVEPWLQGYARGMGASPRRGQCLLRRRSA